MWGEIRSIAMKDRCYSCGNHEGEYVPGTGTHKIASMLRSGICTICDDKRLIEGDDSGDSIYWLDRFIEMNGKRYHSIYVSGNVHFCSECIRPIFGMPLLLWGEKGETMIAFCLECIGKLSD